MNIYHGSSFGYFWGIIPVMFFMFLFGMVVFVLIKSLTNASRGNREYRAPLLTVDAVLVYKRTQVQNGYTWHFMAFQVESGDRMEFVINGDDYNIFSEGEKGRLTFRGEEYLGFKRNN